MNERLVCGSRHLIAGNSRLLADFLAVFPAERDQPGRLSVEHSDASAEPVRWQICDQTDSASSLATRIRDRGIRQLTYHKLRMTRHENFSLYEDGHSTWIIDRKSRTVDVALSPESFSNASFLAGVILPFLFWEILSLERCFLLHAAALQHPSGKSVLLAANSRQGKTTLALSLARAGYGFLTDDLVALREGAEILAYPRSLHVDPRISDAFSELKFLREESAYFSLNPKRVLSRDRLRTLYESKGMTLLSQIPKPSLILFPHIAPVAKSVAKRLSGGEALAQLIPPSALIFVEEALTAPHLRLLGDLVNQAACYSLVLGRDLDERPEDSAVLMEQLFQEAGSSTATSNPNHRKGDVHAATLL